MTNLKWLRVHPIFAPLLMVMAVQCFVDVATKPISFLECVALAAIGTGMAVWSLYLAWRAHKEKS